VAPLTIGELWAVPIMLRLALTENLRRLAEQALAALSDRHDAEVVADPPRRAHVPLPPGPLSDALSFGSSRLLRERGEAESVRSRA